MEAQITAAAGSALYHLLLIRQLMPSLVSRDLTTVLHAMVFSRVNRSAEG